jgi:hypothetical protein
MFSLRRVCAGPGWNRKRNAEGQCEQASSGDEAKATIAEGREETSFDCAGKYECSGK